MTRVLLGKITEAVATIFIVTTIVFVLVHLIPGDPALTVLGGQQANPDPAAVELVRERLGLDQAIHVQYGRFLADLVTGDLGASFTTQRPVTREISTTLPRTLYIVVPAMVLATIVGAVVGVLAARLRDTWLDRTASWTTLVGFSTPVFVVGALAALAFSVQLGWLPLGGYSGPFDDPLAFLQRAAMPIFALALMPTALIMRTARSAAIDELQSPFVNACRSRGYGELRVLVKEVGPNVALPVITIAGLSLGQLMAGSVLVEAVFNWPGLNSLLLRAIAQRDYPTIQGIVLVAAVFFVVINMLTDVIYARFDPRVRRPAAGGGA